MEGLAAGAILVILIVVVLLLRRRRESGIPAQSREEYAGLAYGAAPTLLADREAQELEEGALDPDEVDEPLWWDEGADDEV